MGECEQRARFHDPSKTKIVAKGDIDILGVLRVGLKAGLLEVRGGVA